PLHAFGDDFDHGSRLERRSWSVAIAESCTGGSLAATLVAHPRTSKWFERGFVVYSNDSKCELFGIERPEVESCDGVSETVARYMARAAWVISPADLSVAITGFAGPRQGDEEVGLLLIAAATKVSTHHAIHHLGDIGREAICRRAVDLALMMLIEATTDGQQARSESDDSRTVGLRERGWGVGRKPAKSGERIDTVPIAPKLPFNGDTKADDPTHFRLGTGAHTSPRGHNAGSVA
ncbi:MAG: CinA family protein, partial [Alphaproteobacteria bacterium]